MEDDDNVRAFVRAVLAASGYTVLEAHVPSQALEMAARHPCPIPLLLTDVIMPEMNGRQVAERLEASHAELRVLYMSGYTDDALLHHGVVKEEAAFLQKPFTPAALAQKVREVLDQTTRDGS